MSLVMPKRTFNQSFKNASSRDIQSMIMQMEQEKAFRYEFERDLPFMSRNTHSIMRKRSAPWVKNLLPQGTDRQLGLIPTQFNKLVKDRTSSKRFVNAPAYYRLPASINQQSKQEALKARIRDLDLWDVYDCLHQITSPSLFHSCVT